MLRDADRPLSAPEIAAEAVRRGLIVPAGKTPGNTMSATLYRCTLTGNPDIERVAKPGHGRYHYDVMRKAKKRQSPAPGLKGG